MLASNVATFTTSVLTGIAFDDRGLRCYCESRNEYIRAIDAIGL